MEIKKFSDILNEDMSYSTIFGKNVSHYDSLKERIRNILVHIYTDEKRISEKSFVKYDEAIKIMEEYINSNPSIMERAQEFYEKGKRLEYLSEILYDEFKTNSINENVKHNNKNTVKELMNKLKSYDPADTIFYTLEFF